MSRTLVHTSFWAHARRVEIASLPVCAGLTAALWGRDLPAQLSRSSLTPAQLVNLLTPLLVTCLLLAVRREGGDLDGLAATHLLPHRLGFLAFTGLVAAVSSSAASLAMPSEVGSSYLRNIALYTGVGLGLGGLSTVAGLVAPWVWIAASMAAGQGSTEGQATFDWWAMPLHPGDWHSEVAACVLVLGMAVHLTRG